MNTSDLCYPVLCFSRNFVHIRKTEDELTKTSQYGLKKVRFFDNLTIVDSKGTALEIAGAHKLHGVGLLWGYNVFLNQRIRAKLNIKNSFEMSVDKVKELVLDSFRKWHGWETRGDFTELKKSIKNSRSIAEIIQHLSD